MPYRYFFFLAFLIVSCNTPDNPEKKPEAKVVALENVTVNLPDAPGAVLFQANCQTCHSLRYIQMQHRFPEKTWKKIVDKMIQNFGAPIADTSAQQIVQYLTSIKGARI